MIRHPMTSMPFWNFYAFTTFRQPCSVCLAVLLENTAYCATILDRGTGSTKVWAGRFCTLRDTTICPDAACSRQSHSHRRCRGSSLSVSLMRIWAPDL